MDQKPKLELQVNVPTKIRLTQDKCVDGKSQFGIYHLYNIINGDGSTEYSLFAADQLHDELRKFRQGDELLVTKLASQRGNKLVVTYEVIKVEDKKPETKTNDSFDEFLYQAMEKSLEQSVSLAKKFNSVPIEKIGISLFIARTSGKFSFSN